MVFTAGSETRPSRYLIESRCFNLPRSIRKNDVPRYQNEVSALIERELIRAALTAQYFAVGSILEDRGDTIGTGNLSHDSDRAANGRSAFSQNADAAGTGCCSLHPECAA